MKTIETINPATDSVVKRYEVMSWEEVDRTVNEVQEAYSEWSCLPYSERKKLLHALGDALTASRETFATSITQEMGKPILQARAEIDKCAQYCHYMADHAEAFLQPRMVKTEHVASYVAYLPQGIVYAIMPWNFPVWQVMRFLVPTLLSGNAAILSLSSICTGTSLLIEKTLQKVGIKAFRSIINDHEQASRLIADSRIIAVTLTGSEQTGKKVAAQAGQALKKCVLELGGNDPCIVLEDANLEQAVSISLKSRMSNSGQSCIAVKRVIVVESIYDEFLALVRQQMMNYKIGDPTQADAFILGPLARRDLRDKVHEQVQESIRQGATLILGGEIPKQKGFYYPPTLLTNVTDGVLAAHEEIFGPVVSLIKAKDEKEAIQIANSTRFGLGASIFTQDLARGERIARDKLLAGTTVVNMLVASNERFPFGGVKSSGIGREMSLEGIHEFLNTKTIVVSSAK